jgi:hypothetical protein
MPTLGFDELRVYQCAEQLADQVWTIVRSWDALARDTLGKQLIRAVDSIGANVAEGCGRGTYRDNRRFVGLRGDRCTKLATGFVGLFTASY